MIRNGASATKQTLHFAVKRREWCEDMTYPIKSIEVQLAVWLEFFKGLAMPFILLTGTVKRTV